MLAAKSKVVGETTAPRSKADLNRSWKILVEPVEPFLAEVTGRLLQQANDFSGLVGCDAAAHTECDFHVCA